MARQRSARFCIFCGAVAGSKEHIWSQWIHPLLPAREGDARHSRVAIHFHPTEGESRRGPNNRQGDVRTIRVRAVCAACNNGWMNRCEEAVRPFLTPIICGEPVSLEADDLHRIAQWLAMKVMVAEHDTAQATLTPLAERVDLMDHGKLPTYYRFYVASNVGERALYFRRHSHCIALSKAGPQPPLEGTTKNVQVATFVIGKAIFQVTASRSTEIVIEESSMVLGFHDKARFWPSPESPKTFPAGPRLDDAGIDKIAGIIDRLVTQGNVRWMPLGSEFR